MATGDWTVEKGRLLLSVREAASALAVSRTTLYELMGRGEITPIRIGRCVRVPAAELHRFIEACGAKL
ncbi:MAG: helix-turn-helix domain-containing protein [Ilumatobacteraceae bacterium]